MWGNPGSVHVSEVSRNTLLFSFQDKRKGLQIFKDSPWCVKGHLMNLKQWEKNMVISKINHNLMEIWIQFHGVPLESMDKETAEQLGHGWRECKNEKAMCSWNPQKAKYEPGLGVTQAKPVFSKGVKMNKEEHSEWFVEEEPVRGDENFNQESGDKPTGSSMVGGRYGRGQDLVRETFSGMKGA
ncbi:hypothetical protein PIB30_062159 [Stylosanthes scabra]|uniref:DUF4283 domain-containing protein n=1 Tax=Stylosanthes scabra TaxID=79078 RepID=A0ABU6XMH4_9FABA|nr:hypothetical protein [Stylosanthes scabra]